MIFVTVGTGSDPFDRLLDAVESLPLQEPLVIQAGRSTTRSGAAHTIAYMSFDELLEYVREARVVICHAGVGSVIATISCGTKPVVVPRLKAYGEAVDDHQLHFGRRMAERRLVTLIEDVGELPKALADRKTSKPAEFAKTSLLAEEIGAFLRRNCKNGRINE